MLAFENRCRASRGECWHSKIDVGHHLGNAGIRGSMSDTTSRMLAFKTDVEHHISNAGIQNRCGPSRPTPSAVGRAVIPAHDAHPKEPGSAPAHGCNYFLVRAITPAPMRVELARRSTPSTRKTWSRLHPASSNHRNAELAVEAAQFVEFALFVDHHAPSRANFST
jgi:hypothetical protein